MGALNRMSNGTLTVDGKAVTFGTARRGLAGCEGRKEGIGRKKERKKERKEARKEGRKEVLESLYHCTKRNSPAING